MIQRNSLSVDDSINAAPPWLEAEHSREKLPVASCIMQSSSNELSTLVAFKYM